MPAWPVYVAVSDLLRSCFPNVKHFAYKMKVVISQRMVEIHDHIIVANFLYEAHQLVAVGIVHHQLLTFFHALSIKFPVNLKSAFRNFGDHFLVGKTIGAFRSDLEIEFVTYFFMQQVFFEIR